MSVSALNHNRMLANEREWLATLDTGRRLSCFSNTNGATNHNHNLSTRICQSSYSQAAFIYAFSARSLDRGISGDMYLALYLDLYYFLLPHLSNCGKREKLMEQGEKFRRKQ